MNLTTDDETHGDHGYWRKDGFAHSGHQQS